MAGSEIPGTYSPSISEEEIGVLSSIPSEASSSNAAALYLLSRFMVALLLPDDDLES